MYFFQSGALAVTVSRHLWQYLTPWVHFGGPCHDIFSGTPYFGAIWAKFGPNYSPLGSQKAHRRAPITPKMENRDGNARETWSRIQIFWNFYKILHMGATFLYF